MHPKRIIILHNVKHVLLSITWPPILDEGVSKTNNSMETPRRRSIWRLCLSLLSQSCGNYIITTSATLSCIYKPLMSQTVVCQLIVYGVYCKSITEHRRLEKEAMGKVLTLNCWLVCAPFQGMGVSWVLVSQHDMTTNLMTMT